jgi:hypothetical protein
MRIEKELDDLDVEFELTERDDKADAWHVGTVEVRPTPKARLKQMRVFDCDHDGNLWLSDADYTAKARGGATVTTDGTRSESRKSSRRA